MTIVALTLLFNAYTKEFHLPSHLIASVCYIESNYNVNAYHRHDGEGNSVGICQIKLKTAQWLGFKGTEKQLMKPSVNIYYAAKYLQYLSKRYHGNMIKMVIAYNIGHAGSLTRTTYSDKVLKHQQEAVKNERISVYGTQAKR